MTWLWRRDAPIRELAHALELGLGDRDLLLDLADALGQRGAVGLGHRLLDQGQHVALPDCLAEARQARFPER